jgi:predicted phage baseplate assembly protein
MPSVVLREVSLVPLPENGQSLLSLEAHRGLTCPVKHWVVRSELFDSGASEREYAVEIEEDGRAYLRFGFLGTGWRPEVVGAPFVATYRVGNGSAGNVGRDTIGHIVADSQTITGVRNPLPAQGGTDPVTTETARLHAPEAYRTSKPCVTESDYVEAAERHPQVARAAARLRWTGSGRTAFVYVQRPDDRPMDRDFRRRLAAFMEPFRLAGCELEIIGARPVSIEIALDVYLGPRHQTSVVLAALHEAFSDRRLPDEKTGFFHPSRWTFGQAVYESQVIAQAMAVPGVARVEVRTFRRRGSSNANPIGMGLLEVVRLHNDPEDPSQGIIEFTLS